MSQPYGSAPDVKAVIDLQSVAAANVSFKPLIVPKQFHHKIVIWAYSGFFGDKILAFLENHHIHFLIKAKSYGSFDELVTNYANFRNKILFKP